MFPVVPLGLLHFPWEHTSSQAKECSLGSMQHAPIRGHEASPPSGHEKGSKRCSETERAPAEDAAHLLNLFAVAKKRPQRASKCQVHERRGAGPVGRSGLGPEVALVCGVAHAHLQLAALN